MKVVVIDGQGGKMGGMIIERVKSAGIVCELTAIGTNGIATAAMMRAGADAGATGENPIVVACRTADIIVGPIGVISADSMLGEITAAMAVAIGRSAAKKLLIPVNICNNIVVGAQRISLSGLITETVDLLSEMCGP
ncbi:MAG: DUF3842 family protein [Clostridiales bacterium]|jgi:hypothetical protein|nr:DUF3842 family protein [Clostridiales bacterium]